MQPPAQPRLIVTRPADDADDWVRRLGAAGWPAQALPLIEIGTPSSAAAQAALQRYRAQWFRFDAIMFVSGAAVRHFFESDVRSPPGQECHTRFWAPGPGTGKALEAPLADLGLGPDRIDTPPMDAAQFDSEALWPVVAPQLHRGSRVLVVRGASDPVAIGAGGGNGRQWLIAQCEAAGATVESVAAYERLAPDWSEEKKSELAQACRPGSIWLLSSSEAVSNLLALAPAVDWSPLIALATHPRIGDSARRAGFGQVIATRPALKDVLATLESLRSRS